MLNPMSNQILTEIHVDLDHRDKNTALFRIFLALPVIIFVSSFSEFAGGMMAAAGGFLVLPTVLSLLFNQLCFPYFLEMFTLHMY